MDSQIGYKTIYNLRRAVAGKKSLEVTFPYLVADKEARRRGISIQELLEKYQLAAEYNGFDGVIYKFQKKEGG